MLVRAVTHLFHFDKYLVLFSAAVTQIVIFRGQSDIFICNIDHKAMGNSFLSKN